MADGHGARLFGSALPSGGPSGQGQQVALQTEIFAGVRGGSPAKKILAILSLQLLEIQSDLFFLEGGIMSFIY